MQTENRREPRTKLWSTQRPRVEEDTMKFLKIELGELEAWLIWLSVCLANAKP
jgi:hypothetical protein